MPPTTSRQRVKRAYKNRRHIVIPKKYRKYAFIHKTKCLWISPFLNFKFRKFLYRVFYRFSAAFLSFPPSIFSAHRPKKNSVDGICLVSRETIFFYKNGCFSMHFGAKIPQKRHFLFHVEQLGLNRRQKLFHVKHWFLEHHKYLFFSVFIFSSAFILLCFIRHHLTKIAAFPPIYQQNAVIYPHENFI